MKGMEAIFVSLNACSVISKIMSFNQKLRADLYAVLRYRLRNMGTKKNEGFTHPGTGIIEDNNFSLPLRF